MKESQYGTLWLLKLPYVVPSRVPFSTGVTHHCFLGKYISFSWVLASWGFFVVFCFFFQMSQTFCGAIYIPPPLYPLPALHTFLCSLVFFPWYTLPCTMVTSSSRPPDSSSSPIGSLFAACIVLSSFSGKNSAVVQCQTTLNKEARDGSDTSMHL